MYGAFGTPVALLLWFNFMAKLLLYCAAWTATPRHAPDPRSPSPPSPGPTTAARPAGRDDAMTRWPGQRRRRRPVPRPARRLALPGSLPETVPGSGRRRRMTAMTTARTSAVPAVMPAAVHRPLDEDDEALADASIRLAADEVGRGVAEADAFSLAQRRHQGADRLRGGARLEAPVQQRAGLVVDLVVTRVPGSSR